MDSGQVVMAALILQIALFPAAAATTTSAATQRSRSALCVHFSLNSVDHALLLHPDETADAAHLPQLSDDGGDPSELRHELVTAFLDHRVRMELALRAEAERFFRRSRTGPQLYVGSQSCVAAAGQSTLGGGMAVWDGWFFAQRPSFDVLNEGDWSAYFGRAPLARLAVSSEVVGSLGVKNAAALATLAARYMRRRGDAVVELALQRGAERSALEEALSTAGFLVGAVQDAAESSAAEPPWSTAASWRVGGRRSTILRCVRARDAAAAATPSYSLAINLARRPDRWTKMQRDYAATGLSAPLLRFEATDGRDPTQLDLFTDASQRALFDLSAWRGSRQNPHQDHGFRTSVLGCALSHYRAWRRIAADASLEDQDSVLVLEDDTMFDPSFARRWPGVRAALEIDPSWELAFLGDSTGDGRVALYDDRSVHGGLLYELSADSRAFGGGLFAYVLRKRGAAALLDAVRRAGGIHQEVDWFAFEQFASLRCYRTAHRLATADIRTERDSNINEEYPQMRLLFDRYADAAAVDFKVTVPASDSVQPPSFDIAVDVSVKEPPGVFLERNKHSVLCLELERRADLGPTFQTDAGRIASSLGCETFMAGARPIVGLRPGLYTLKTAVVTIAAETIAATETRFSVSALAGEL